MGPGLLFPPSLSLFISFFFFFSLHFPPFYFRELEILLLYKDEDISIHSDFYTGNLVLLKNQCFFLLLLVFCSLLLKDLISLIVLFVFPLRKILQLSLKAIVQNNKL